MASYTFNNIKYPSVTTITGLLDKSRALMGWAVKLMKIYIEENKDCYLKEGYGFAKLLEDARKNYRDAQKYACDIGKDVHHAIENYIKHGKDVVGEMPDEVISALSAFWDWEEANIEKWIESEKPVFSPNCYYLRGKIIPSREAYKKKGGLKKNVEIIPGFAGTLDAIAKIKKNPSDKFLVPGGNYVIDFKSSKGFYDGYDLQIAAYRLARESLQGSEAKYSGKYSAAVLKYPKINLDGMGVLRLDKETGMPEWKDYSGKYARARDAFLELLKFYYLQKNRRLKGNELVKNFKEQYKTKSKKTKKKSCKKAG